MKLNLAYKVKSAALQFAIFIAVLIALLLGSLVLYVYTFIYLKEQSKATIENIQLADSGMNYLLQQPSGVNNNDTITVLDLANENQTVKVIKEPWGVFEKALVKTGHRKKIFIKTALLGSEINADTSPTLFLQETYNPLSIVGSTRIQGNIYLPSQGIKPGYIAGQSYFGSKLVYGVTKKSNTSLPNIEKRILNKLALFLKEKQPLNEEIPLKETNNRRSFNSFKSKTKHIYSSQPIFLKNDEIVGNIIVKSDTIITVSKTANLKDVILIAPVILIEDQVKGNFQCIASRNIKIGKECQLSYPSSLVLIQDNKVSRKTSSSKPFENQIYIDSKATIKGCVNYIQTKETVDFNTQIVLEKDSKIKGQVYCQGNFELKGTVSGSVFTKQFISNTAGSVFVNHILNGCIENENIPNHYAGIQLEKNAKTIVKWLY